jgi:hypothetical protein
MTKQKTISLQWIPNSISRHEAKQQYGDMGSVLEIGSHAIVRPPEVATYLV